MTWFVDDSEANYDDGNGPGALISGGKVNVFINKEFKKNGKGLTSKMTNDLNKTIRDAFCL